MGRKVEIVISVRLEEGREVRQTTLNDDIQEETKKLVRNLAEEHGYGVTNADVEWTSIHEKKPSQVMRGRKRRYTFARRIRSPKGE